MKLGQQTFLTSLILLSALALPSGCSRSEKNKEPEAAPNDETAAPPTTAVPVPAKPESITIEGQIFVVTRARDNVAMGDQAIYLVNFPELQNYYATNAATWLVNLADLHQKVLSNAGNYVNLYADDIAKLQAAKAHWQQIAADENNPPDQIENAIEWERKIDGEIDDLRLKKISSQERMDLYVAADEESNLLDEIVCPGDGRPVGTVADAITDSTGRFRIEVPDEYEKSNLCLVAKATREVADDVEKYCWVEPVNQDDARDGKLEVILSNDESHTYSNLLDLLPDQTAWARFEVYITNGDDYICGQISAEETAEASNGE